MPSGRQPIVKFARLIAMLQRGPQTRLTIQAKLDIGPKCCRHWIKTLRDAKVIHRIGYTRNMRNQPGYAIYAMGHERDLEIVPMTPAERAKRYRQRKATIDGAWPMNARSQLPAASSGPETVSIVRGRAPA